MVRLENFSKGKSIDEERKKLANLNENMKFKGGPKDHKYAHKFRKKFRPQNLNKLHSSLDVKKHLKDRPSAKEGQSPFRSTATRKSIRVTLKAKNTIKARKSTTSKQKSPT